MKKFIVLCAAALLSSAAAADNHGPPQPSAYGQYYAVTVADPAAFVEALTKYRNSATGRQLQSSVTISQNIANGESSATHTVAVFYPSAKAMSDGLALAAQSDDWAEFLRSMDGIATVEAENVFTVVRTIGNDESVGGPGTATMLLGLKVTDLGRFMAGMDAMANSKAAAAFPGNIVSGEVIAMGEVPGTHWVSFQAKDVATLLTGVQAFMSSADFANYAKDAGEFREVVGRFLSRNIVSLSPSEG